MPALISSRLVTCLCSITRMWSLISTCLLAIHMTLKMVLITQEYKNENENENLGEPRHDEERRWMRKIYTMNLRKYQYQNLEIRNLQAAASMRHPTNDGEQWIKE